MIPLSAVWAGEARDHHFKAPPLFLGKTEGSTPFRFSLHVGDVGHSGSSKGMVVRRSFVRRQRSGVRQLHSGMRSSRPSFPERDFPSHVGLRTLRNLACCDERSMALAIEHRVDGALGGHADVSVEATHQQFADLARAPMRLLALEPNDQGLDRNCRSYPLSVRPDSMLRGLLDRHERSRSGRGLSLPRFG